MTLSEAFLLFFIFLWVINVIFAALVIIFERRSPASTWTWLCVLFFIPFFGFLAYLVFGQNARNHKIFTHKSNNDKVTYFRYIKEFVDGRNRQSPKEQKRIIKSEELLHKNPKYKTVEDLIYLGLSSNSHLTFDNDIKLFFDGNDKFDSMLKDIENARNFVFVEYYIFRNDKIGNTLVNTLAKKAAQGVEVKVLYDGMGCIHLPLNFFKRIDDNGGKASSFFPPFFPYINVRLNYRNHRKICVIDGEIGYVGGFNVGDEYLGRKKRFGNWRDTHARIVGSAVEQITLRFIMDYNFSLRSDTMSIKMEEKYFPVKIEKPTGNSKVQIISSGPDTVYNNVKNGYFKMMNEAQRKIYFVTPYFVPDQSIIDALKVAALSGIDVRIIFPANPDHLFVYWASLSYVGELLTTGVRCFQYKKGFIHSKSILIDGIVCSVGSANMDIRSFELNFEVNAFIYDKKATLALEKEFLSALNDCEEITQQMYEKRSFTVKLREAISRLISPIL